MGRGEQQGGCLWAGISAFAAEQRTPKGTGAGLGQARPGGAWGRAPGRATLPRVSSIPAWGLGPFPVLGTPQEATSFLNSKVPSAEAWLLTSCLASFPRASAGAEVAGLGRAALEEAGVLPGALLSLPTKALGPRLP